MILSILNDFLEVFFLAHALFFFVREVIIYYPLNHLLMCISAAAMTIPMWTISALRLIEVSVPGWLLFSEEPAGVGLRLRVVLLCFLIAVWSPWELRGNSPAQQTTT